MTDYSHNNINLLPYDLKKKRIKKHNYFSEKVDYTEGNNKKFQAVPAASVTGMHAPKISEFKSQRQDSPKTESYMMPKPQTSIIKNLFGRFSHNNTKSAKTDIGDNSKFNIENYKKTPTDERIFKVDKKELVKQQTYAPVNKANQFDVELLTGEYAREFERVNPYSFLGISVVITILLVAIVFAGAFIYESKSKDMVNKEIQINNVLGETIKTYKSLADEDSKLREKIDVISALLESHISWKIFLKNLEEETIPEVTYNDMSVSTSGVLSISAVAKDYTSLARQMVVFQETDWIESIDITSAHFQEVTTSGQGGVAFNIQIKIDNNILSVDE